LCLDPSAADLIALFLYQADVASSIAREIGGKENVSINGTQAASDVSAPCDGSSLFIFYSFLQNDLYSKFS